MLYQVSSDLAEVNRIKKAPAFQKFYQKTPMYLLDNETVSPVTATMMERNYENNKIRCNLFVLVDILKIEF